MSKMKKLSKREDSVLKMIIEGNKNKIISKELGINEKTVSTYKARLMKKLGLTSEDTVINIKQAAVEKGLIPRDNYTLTDLKKALDDGIDFGLECVGICTSKKQSDFVASWLEDNS